MDISPNSTIILYTALPLDPDYNDTIYFSSLSAQTSFFQSSYIKRRFTSNTYQRVNRGQFEAKCLADDIYDCNYMAFQNTNFGSKWFYAFINSIEYINNGNALVSFTIDVIQTYMFDVELEQCYVEREHSATDVRGDNILPEPVQLAEYTIDGYTRINPQIDDYYLNELDVVVMYVDVSAADVEGAFYNRTYSGCRLKAFLTDDDWTQSSTWIQALETFLADYIQKPDSIVNMFMCPHFISQGTAGGHDITQAQSNDILTVAIPFGANQFTAVENYTVQNQKLFTYPYYYLHVDDSNQGSLALRLEYFTQSPRLSIFGSGTSPVQLSLLPLYYKGGGNTQNPYRCEKLTLAEYPICSWNYDTYKAWVAQQGLQTVVKGVTSGIASAATLDFGGAAEAGLGAAMSFYTASLQADTVKGNISNGNALYAHDLLGFNYGFARQPVEIVQVIDDFFTRYGYTTNRVKVPNRNVRPHWTYTKTKDCAVKGSCPSDDVAKIEAVYNSGIRFWRNASEIGDYSLDNRVV